MGFSIKPGDPRSPDNFANLEGTPKMEALGQLASLEAADGLTPAEKTALQSMAAGMINDPSLPAPDKQALEKWITYLQQYPVTNTPSQQANLPTFNNVAPTKNPWMQAGFTYLLAVVLSKLELVMDKVIQANTKLKVAMINATVAMAKEAYACGIAAGEAQQKTLLQEQLTNIVGAATAGAQMAAQMTVFGVSSAAHSQIESDKEDTLKTQEGKTPDEQKEIRATARDDAATKRQILGEKESLANNIINNVGTVINSITGAYAAGQKAELALDQATSQAIKDMLDKLVQTLQQTSQSADQGIDAMSKQIQAMAQLMKDFSSTVAQSMWR